MFCDSPPVTPILFRKFSGVIVLWREFSHLIQHDIWCLQVVDEMERAEHMLDEADKIGCRSFVSAADVVNGNYKLNLAFVANLFNMHPGFEQQVDGVDIDFSAVPEETREERSEFICWCVLTELVNVGSNIVILYNQRFFFANDWRKIIVEDRCLAQVCVFRSSPERWPNKPGKNVCQSICMYVHTYVHNETQCRHKPNSDVC